MLQSQEGNNETVRYRYSLSTMLYKSPHVYEILVDDMWLLYAPDAVGLPVLVSPPAARVSGLFDEGQTVGQLAADRNNEDWVFAGRSPIRNLAFLRRVSSGPQNARINIR